MITNERQFLITRTQLAKWRKAIQGFDLKEAKERTGSEALARAELDALKSEEEVLAAQVKEYEALKLGKVNVLKAENLEELPKILIKARIARNLTQRQLAERLGLKEQQIQRYESEYYASTSLRRLAEIADALELNVSEIAELRPKPTKGKEEIDWRLFPIKEMYRRNWFEGFRGSLHAAMTEADSLVENFVKGILERPAAALHRKRVRSKSSLNEYALLAWECRVLKLAEKSRPDGDYHPNAIDDDWLRRLVQESRHSDGPRRARKRLARAGISMIIEPHLPQTHLDGAAFLHRGMPVIGLTLRHDRLDNFWFVLLHELIHLTKHLRKDQLEGIFDEIDGEGAAEIDELEREADDLAGRALIPEEAWNIALARYVRSEQSVKTLAKKLRISPTIIAGRIRNEANNYVILTELVGHGEVRKQFPEIAFGS